MQIVLPGDKNNDAHSTDTIDSHSGGTIPSYAKKKAAVVYPVTFRLGILITQIGGGTLGRESKKNQTHPRLEERTIPPLRKKGVSPKNGSGRGLAKRENREREKKK